MANKYQGQKGIRFSDLIQDTVNEGSQAMETRNNVLYTIDETMGDAIKTKLATSPKADLYSKRMDQSLEILAEASMHKGMEETADKIKAWQQAKANGTLGITDAVDIRIALDDEGIFGRRGTALETPGAQGRLNIRTDLKDMIEELTNDIVVSDG